MNDDFEPDDDGCDEESMRSDDENETTTVVLEKISLSGLRQEIVECVVSRLTSQLLSKMERRLDQKIMPAIEKAVMASVVARVEAAMVAPIQKTDHYGNPKGETVTLAEMAEKATVNYLGTTESYGGNRSQTRLDSAIMKAVGANVDIVAAKFVGEAMTKFKADLATAASKEMGVAVLKLLGMKV